MFDLIKRVCGLHSNEKRNIDLIRKSKYFNEKYYLDENPDVKMDACKHYYKYGYKEGKSPSFEFSNDYYLKNNKDVKDAGINPLLHYLKFGQSENRPIAKENGLSLNTILNIDFNCFYNYKLYFSDDVRYINLFINELNNNVLDILELIKYLLKLSQNLEYKLRIIYLIADFENLKKIFSKNNIKLNDNIILLNIKANNFIEVSMDDMYVASDYKTAIALLNTYSLNKKIFYYVEDSKNGNFEDIFNISSVCYNKNVIPLINDSTRLDSLNKYELKVSKDILKLTDKDDVYCDFNNMFYTKANIINILLLKKIINDNLSLTALTDNYKRFHFDTGLCLKRYNAHKKYDHSLVIGNKKSKDSINIYINSLKTQKIPFIDINKIETLNNATILEGEDIYKIILVDGGE